MNVNAREDFTGKDSVDEVNEALDSVVNNANAKYDR